MSSTNYKIKILSKDLPFPVVDVNQEFLPQKLLNQLIDSPSSIHICTINAEIAHHLLNTRRSKTALESVNYFIPDGIGVSLAFRYLFGVKAGKLPGIELADELLKECSIRGWNIALYGATSERISLASQHIRQKYNGISISAVLDGYSGLDQIEDFLIKCQRSSVRLVLVALGHPAQDEFISKHINSLSAVWVGVGGSFDVWSGSKQRAPKVLSIIGLEWIYRILQDPSPKRLRRSLDLPAFCVDMFYFRIRQFCNKRFRQIPSF